MVLKRAAARREHSRRTSKCFQYTCLSSFADIMAPCRHAHKPPHLFSVMGRSCLQQLSGVLMPSTTLSPSSHQCRLILQNMYIWTCMHQDMHGHACTGTCTDNEHAWTCMYRQSCDMHALCADSYFTFPASIMTSPNSFMACTVRSLLPTSCSICSTLL